jgi:hypothetical protein
MRKREILESRHRSELSDMVVRLCGSKETADKWWYLPNRAFDMARPIETDIEIVRDYLIWHSTEQY